MKAKIELNHTIVNVRDKQESATFLSDIFGLPAPEPFSHFLVVQTTNGVSLDFTETDENIERQHYAFLVGDDEFDHAFEKIKKRRIPYWADPAKTLPNRINTHFGGRGCYFEEPSGHLLEMITRPYGREN